MSGDRQPGEEGGQPRPPESAQPASLADLVEESLILPWEDRGVDEPDPPQPEGAPEDEGEADDSAELSELLARLARIPDVEPDVATSWTPQLAAGDRVGRFLLRREIGRGGFGVVFEALDTELGRVVAFKAVRPGRRLSGKSEGLLRAEAEAVARLNHPNIVTLHDFGQGPTGPYLIFELLRGETMADRLRRGPLPLREAVDVAADVARVLAHAHAAGVVHRDLKPANVFLGADGAVKVLDFGLAHLFGRAGAASGGTPGYMAPEQWREEPGDARVDLFALGVLLHHMIAGRVPYRVTRDRSEALEPGPPPELPRGAAPAPLRRLVARMLEKDAAARPDSAQEVLDALLPVQRRLAPGWKRGPVLGVALAVAASVAGVGLFDAWRTSPGRERPLLLAVADFENATGERELDGLSGLLITSLEQSRRLEVLTRSRLTALLRRVGEEGAARIDERIAREVARAAGARMLLLGSCRLLGTEYVLQVRAVEPERDRTVFTVAARAGAREEVPEALDALSQRARRALDERMDEIRVAQVSVGQAVTSSLEAYHHYFLGQDCVDRPSQAGSWNSVANLCGDHFRRALAVDPTFALAHYQLAYLLGTEAPGDPDLAAHMDASLRYVDRAPPKEAALIRAWKAHLDGRDDEALARYGALLADFPDDVHALFLSGLIHLERGAVGVALPFLEKVLALDPGAETSLDLLVSSLGALRRHERLKGVVADAAGGPPTPAAAHAVVRGLVWLGDAPAAVEAARRALAAGGGPSAAADLAGALSAAGRYAEQEVELRRRVEAEPFQAETWYSLAGAVRAQGRRREALRLLDGIAARVSASRAGVVQYVRAMLVAGDGDGGVLWRESAKAAALYPAVAGDLAVVLALAGDLAHAAELGAGLPEGSTAAEEIAALAAWHRGDVASAVARLAALDARDPWPQGALAPSYLLVEVSAAAGDASGTLSAVARLRSLWPRGIWRSWAMPRSAYLAAAAHAELADLDAARSELGRLLGWLEHADPDLPLAREARALQARLAQ